MQIASIKAYQVLDSRGEPTIRVRMESASGNHARFDAPSGVTNASAAAKERRDEDAAVYGGRGVSGNVDAITGVIAPKFIGYPLGHQADFDTLITALDGTKDRSNLGTNTLTALSGAYFLLSCYENKKEVWQSVADLLGTTPAMPRLYANMVAGGAHAPGLEVQEFMAVPQDTSPVIATQMVYSLYRTLQQIFENLYGPSVHLVSDEGGMAPLGAGPEVVLDALQQFASKGQNKFDIAIDMSANNFFNGSGYQFGGQILTMQQLGAMYLDWDRKFPMLSIEDPFADQDLEGLKMLSIAQGRKFFVAGDDFTATDAKRITDLAAQKLIGAVIIKPNQVGTMSDMFDAMRSAQAAGVKLIISHRSGESNDTLLADIAYGAAAFGFKLGSPVRGERTAKYNRLIEIEQDTKPKPAPANASAPRVTAPTNLGVPLPPVPVVAPASIPVGTPTQFSAGNPMVGSPVSVPQPPPPSPTTISFNTPPPPSAAIHRGPALSEQAAHAMHNYEGAESEMADDLEGTQAAPIHAGHAQPFSPLESGGARPLLPASPIGYASPSPVSQASAPTPPPFRY